MANKNEDLADPKEFGTAKRTTNKKQVINTGLPVHGLWGILLLIVCASIMYANYRVFFGVEELISRLMLIPSTLAVVTFLIYKSAK